MILAAMIWCFGLVPNAPYTCRVFGPELRHPHLCPCPLVIVSGASGDLRFYPVEYRPDLGDSVIVERM